MSTGGDYSARAVGQASAETIKDVNVRYHDVAAADYDSKWGISYEEQGRRQVVGKLEKALGQPLASVDRTLEIGAGTGYFTLNLLRAGIVREAVATDISPGMLAALQESADRLGVEVETVCTEAAQLPFPDDSFDLVFGHAILHHLPDLDAAFREFRRVLRPGGLLAFAGEPSHHGDRLAAYPKRAALAIAPAWRRLVGAGKRLGWDDPGEAQEHALEHVVDVHAFTPGDLSGFARRAGFEGVRVSGEELVAGWFGWANRTLESTAESRQIAPLWFRYAYHGYLALKEVDERLLEPRLPPAIFYNLLISARAPRSGEKARGKRVNGSAVRSAEWAAS
jgi:ubiquinone/menaquinone biosynthesis C-methylase UbiE